MITQFAQEGYDFYVEPQVVLGWKWDLFLALLFAILALVAFVLLAGARGRFSWLKSLASLGRHSICLILVLYLFICVAFGFIYHAMFQYNSRHFSVNAPTWNKKMFEAIDKHQAAVDNTYEAMEILTLTVAGLRSKEGRDLLARMAKAIGGHARTVYVTCLALSIVGPPKLLSQEEAEIRTRFTGRPEDLDGLLRGQQSLLRDRPELLSPILGWDKLRQLANDDLRSMKSMLRKWLESTVKSFRPLKNYTGAEDTARLREYVVGALGVQLPPQYKVDLKLAVDAISMSVIPDEALLMLGTGNLERLYDFMYFSVSTLPTVGYGDILPNSTLARAIAALEILLGIVVLVFMVGEFLMNK